MTIEAFEVVWVPPASVWSVTAAADVWLRSVITSPAANVTITWPWFCCVPAPEPNVAPEMAAPWRRMDGVGGEGQPGWRTRREGRLGYGAPHHVQMNGTLMTQGGGGGQSPTQGSG